MKFKNLLSLGAMLSCGLVAQAQVPVFHESFEAAQTKQPTEVGYYEEINKEEGTYYLDEVDLVEANIAGIIYNGNVIRVDLGYATNAKTLAGTKGYYVLPNDCVTVTVGGSEVVVESVETRSDGYLYIFLANAVKEGEVEVQFRNPAEGGLQYAEGEAITGNVLDFIEKAEYDENFNADISSWLYQEPVLVNTTPIDGSFCLDGNISEFTFTFDRKVYSVANEAGGAPVAKLSDNTVLKLKEGTPETTNTLTFVREGADLAEGSYSVTVDNVISSYCTEGKQASLAFEVGKVKFAETIYDKVGSALFPEAADGSIPDGWTVYSDGELRESGTTYSSGGRAFSTVAPQGKGIYTRANNGDGSIQSPVVAIPSGDIEIRSYMAYWSSSSNIQIDVCDESGNVVTTQTFTPAVAGEAGRNNSGFMFEACPIRFHTEGGNFYVKYTLLTSGYNGMFVGGYDVFTYKITEGASTEAEVAFSDATFGGANGVSVADNSAPAQGSGWALYQATDDLSSKWKKEPGKDYNYSGIRIFNLGIKNLSAGWYTNGNWPLTYAIYGSQESEGENEPLLHLKSGRHQITYYTSNWKENSANAGKDHIVYFELADKESETVIYERKDKIEKCDMNGNRNANVTAEKIQFNVTIPEEGDYTIKFGGSTEQLIGNIKIEKLGSQTAYYLGMVNSARDLAIAEYELAEDATFDGTTKTALKAAIDKYADPSFLHTPAEATAAKAELEELTKAMETRREYVARYDKALKAALAILEEVGEKEATEDDPGHEATKYANLEAFSQLTETYQKYAETTSLQLEDAELMSATTDLENKTTWLRNMKDKCIALLTKQVVDAAATLVKLDESLVDDGQVIAAGNALTDDQQLANILNLRITKTIYDKLAAGDNPFSILDTDPTVEVADSINLSSFIQNANLYTTETDINKNLTDIKNLPGWNIDVIAGTPSVEWGWVAFNANEYNPVNDQFLVCGWNTEWNLYQTVKNLPVGKYTYVSSTQDRGFEDTSNDKNAYAAEHETWHVTGNKSGVETEGDILSYIWWQVGEQKDSVGYVIDNQGQWYGMTDCVSKQFDVPANAEGKTGEVTIGSHPKEFQGAASADNFRLYMVGKAEGFDYAAAAKKLADDVAASIEKTPAAPEGAPASVAYYDLSGRQVANPQGVAIKVERWANGYTKVSKVVEK